MEFDVVEGVRRGFEVAFRAGRLGFSHLVQRLAGYPLLVDLLINESIPANGQPQLLG